MDTVLNDAVLARQNRCCRGSGGRSEENRASGFAPAFQDLITRTVYPSRFADGRLAPCHILDGLPDEVVVGRDGRGRVASVKASVVAGFVRDGRFYTREEAMVAVATRGRRNAGTRACGWIRKAKGGRGGHGRNYTPG